MPSSPAGRILAGTLLLGAAVATAGAQPAPSAPNPPARATQANWALANRFAPQALRPILYTNAVVPHWLGKSDSLWYNWRDRNGSHFYLVVPTTGTKRALFDREQLAARLAETSRRPIDPNNLPFTTLAFTKDHKAFRFTADSVRYEWSVVAETLKSLGKPPREAPPDEEREERRTVGGGGGGIIANVAGRGREWKNYSPDSTAFAFARDHNLFVVDVAKGDTVQVTTDGVLDNSFGFRDTTENKRQLDRLAQGGGQQDENGNGDQGDTDVADKGEMRARPAVVWSTDSKAFAIVRMDQRKVGELYLVNVLADPRPVVLHYRYAMPGEANVPQSELWVYRRGDRAAKRLDIGRWRDQRLMDVHWPLGSDAVRLVRRDRAQRNLDLLEVNVASGKLSTILSESIENASLDPQPVRYLKPGGDLLWWSERSGWGHWYAYDFKGGASPKRALSSGAWHADAIAAVDSIRGVVWFAGNGREAGENPYYTHLYRATGDAPGVTLIDPGNFTHIETVSPSKRFLIDSYSRIDAPTKTVLRDATTGRVVMALEETDISKLKELGWKPPETFVVKAADGVTDIYGNMWKPFDFDSTKSYPIIANVYPGPQTESITFPFQASNVPQQLAQLGFIVIQIGNRGGSPQRSLAYHRYGYYNLRDYALADKKSGIEQLAARNKYIDLDRVGIYGHSGGGFLTAAALMLPPYNDFFKVGWSESGNHDNNIYNYNWSEWNHGMKPVMPKMATDSARSGRGVARTGASGTGPQATSDASSGMSPADTTTSMLDSTRYEIRIPTNMELAPNLKGRLMLTTGDLDNNVHPGGTIRMANALIKANKRFDFMLVPGQPHGYRDMVNYTNRMMLEYFAQHLMGDRDLPGADIR